MDNSTDIFFEENDLWSLLQLVAFFKVGFLLLITVVINLSNISTIAGHNGLRSCGYFHLIVLYSVFNIVYFLLQLFDLALVFVMPQSISDYFANLDGMDLYLRDIIMAFIGLQILLLCLLTLEHRLNLSRHFYFKPKGQTCFRVFMTFLALSMVIATLAIVFLLRFTEVFYSKNFLNN